MPRGGGEIVSRTEVSINPQSVCPLAVMDEHCVPLADIILRRFIDVYHALPELWNSSSPNYSNKYNRNEGLKTLLEVYKELKPDATLTDVRKKINTLRSNFRRELNRIKASERSSADPEDVYTPSSWVFYKLYFLLDAERPSAIIDGDEEAEEKSTPSLHSAFKKTQSLVSKRTPSVSSLASKQPPLKKSKSQSGPKARLSLACNLLSSNKGEKSSETDEFLDIARVWANKLRGLDPNQRKFAEKAINDVLFEADLGTLNRHSVQINVPSQPR